MAAVIFHAPPSHGLLVFVVYFSAFDALTDKTPDEVRGEFNITQPFSAEVERTLREENKWSTEPPMGS